MKMLSIEEELKNNSYPGRGIVIGKTQDGTKAVTAYFIMGRSENSRNRVFVEDRIFNFVLNFQSVHRKTTLVCTSLLRLCLILCGTGSVRGIGRAGRVIRRIRAQSRVHIGIHLQRAILHGKVGIGDVHHQITGAGTIPSFV